jgi:hypothetical protein
MPTDTDAPIPPPLPLPGRPPLRVQCLRPVQERGTGQVAGGGGAGSAGGRRRPASKRVLEAEAEAD